MPDSAPIDPSRRSAEQTADAIPIPEADARARKARTVRIQDILAAHARALDVRLEEGMREMRLAMEAAVRRSDIREVPEAAAPPPPQPAPVPIAPVAAPVQAPISQPAPIREDVARGLAQQTEERFQALALRLQRIEDAVRTVALSGGGGELGSKIQELTEGMDRVAATEEDLFDRFLDAQRAGLEDLTRRVGAGVTAVIRAMQTELSATITRLELTADTSVSVSPDDAARLERTMMAIAERQEEMLDGRLAELRESIAGVHPPDETEEVAPPDKPANGKAATKKKTDPGKGSQTNREAAREAAITTFEDEAWPWPEPDGTPEGSVAQPEAADAEADPAPEAVNVVEVADVPETAEAEDPSEEAEVDSEAKDETEVEEPETAEVGEATTIPDEVTDTQIDAVFEESPKPKKRRRRKRKKAAEPEAEAATEPEAAIEEVTEEPTEA